MEIYENSSDRTVTLDVPVTPTGNTMEVSLEKDGRKVHDFATVSYAAGKYSVVIPFAYTQEEGEYEIRWTFDYLEDGQPFSYDRTTPLSVVTPYLKVSEIKDISEGALSDADALKIEKLIRYTINSNVGQSFGKTTTTKVVTARTAGAISVSIPIVRLLRVDGVDAAGRYSVDPSGHYVIKNAPYGVPNVKQDYYGWHQHVGGVIHNPNNVNIKAFQNREYAIEAVWGWNSVPQEVVQAAELLVEDFLDDDSIYRDRYLKSMSAADWRMEFDPQAYVNTGNVKADQLLQKFMAQPGWVVI